MICPNCERRIEDDAAVCEYCGKVVPDPEEQEQEPEQELIEEPKPLRGFFGAILGAALSCAILVLLPKLGLSPIFGGIVVAFLIFIGYRLLNKNVTKIGFGVCIMFILITPYFANQLIWAAYEMSAINELSGFPTEGLSLMEKFLLVPVALDEGKINVLSYFMGLFKLYIFTAVGAVAYLGGVARGRRKKKMKEQ